MIQKTQLEKLYKQFADSKKTLDALRTRLVADMYRCLVERINYRERIKKIIHINRNLAPAAPYLVKMYEKIKKRDLERVQVPGYTGAVATSIAFAWLIHKYNVNENAKVLVDNEQRKEIGEKKEAFIMSDIQHNRTERKYFYLCSSHSDSAKDHEPYQGKVYFDEECDDFKALMLAHKYHMKSYQWVIGKPVWMVTRPNCRHYFKALSYSEVAGKSYDELIEENKMHRKIGQRGDIIQTMNDRGKKIDFVIKSYEDRLRLHQEMFKIRPNTLLKRAIEKDMVLIKKWKKQFKNS